MTTAHTIGRQHIGQTVSVMIGADDGQTEVAGILRWITLTSDEVILAIEESEELGALEWTLRPADEVMVR